MPAKPAVRTFVTGAGAAALCLAGLLAAAPAAFAEDSTSWPSLKKEFFGTSPIAEEDGVVALEAPVRAEDAALVPLTITMPAGSGGAAKRLTLIVDENPAPLVGVFTFGQSSGSGALQLTTRVRLDRYTNVRAITEMADGSLHMTVKFVKASGGCSAPVGKDAESAMEGAGRMQIKTVAGKSASGLNLAQVMIRHPNFNGMQMDQVTRNYTPARFIDAVEVKDGSGTVFSLAGGFSIAENPHFIFTYPAGAKGTISVTAKDTSGAVYQGKSTTDGS